MNLLEHVQNYANRFSETDWQIFQKLKMVKDAESLTIQEFAENCHVSTTTIFRFCRKVELQGFAELKALLVYGEQERKTIHKDSVKAIYHQVVDYIETFPTDNFFEAIHQSKAIYLLACSDLELRLAKEMQRIFLPLGKPLFILPNMAAIESGQDGLMDSVLVIIRIDTENKTSITLQNPQQLNQTYVAVLGDFKELPFLTDERFYIPNLHAEGLLPVPHLTPFILAVELLYLKMQLS